MSDVSDFIIFLKRVPPQQPVRIPTAFPCFDTGRLCSNLDALGCHLTLFLAHIDGIVVGKLSIWIKLISYADQLSKDHLPESP